MRSRAVVPRWIATRRGMRSRASGVARLKARFRFLPWPVTREAVIWGLFVFLGVTCRIARERVPNIGELQSLETSLANLTASFRRRSPAAGLEREEYCRH